MDGVYFTAAGSFDAAAFLLFTACCHIGRYYPLLSAEEYGFGL